MRGEILEMNFQTLIPEPPLSDCVEQFVLSHGHRPGHLVEQVLPNGFMQLIIDLRDGGGTSSGDLLRECGGVVVSGIQSRTVAVDAASMESVICVPFKVGSAIRLFRCAADELKDAHVPLESLWGDAATDLRERLLEAAPAERLHLLEKLLSQRLLTDKSLHPALEIAIRTFDAEPWRTTGAIIEEVGLSERRFIQLFKQQVGTTPKQYCRVQRFQRALHRIGQTSEPNWVHVALDCGYFDQPHFVNEFRSLAGMSPTQYLSRNRPHRNHVVTGNTVTGSSPRV